MDLTIAAIGQARSTAVIAGALVLLTACSSYHSRLPTPTPFPRDEIVLERKGSVLGDYTLRYPSTWKIHERRNGQIAVLTPRAGKGRLRLVAMVEHDPPAALSRAYAEVVCKRALRSVGLQANISAVRTVAEDHMVILSEGIAAGTTISEVVHVFGAGQVVVAFFRAPSTDTHFSTAKRIMKSLRLKPSA